MIIFIHDLFKISREVSNTDSVEIYHPLTSQISEVVMDYYDMNGAPPDKAVKMACTVIATVPILCIYPFVQKYFTKGVMVGAVKG